jgi:uncharacterized protein YjbI with pentapeptide repeats
MKINRHFLLGLVIGACVVVCAAIVGIPVLLNKALNTQQAQLQQQLDKEARAAEVLRISGLNSIMRDLMADIADELKQSPAHSLQEETINRIAALSYGLISNTADSNGFSLNTLSPERGQLLLMLSALKMDSVSFQKIKQQTSFAYARLRNADLQGSDLRGIDLKGADLQNTNLSNANLNEATLHDANLLGARMNNTSLGSADLSRANLQWAELNMANLEHANLSGTEIMSAQLRNANLRNANLQWADLSGAFLNGSDCTSANLHGTIFKRANLNHTLLVDVNLYLGILTDATLEAADLTGANIEYATVTQPDWFAQLRTWSVQGLDSIEHKYHMVNAGTTSQPQYRARKK